MKEKRPQKSQSSQPPNTKRTKITPTGDAGKRKGEKEKEGEGEMGKAETTGSQIIAKWCLIHKDSLGRYADLSGQFYEVTEFA